MENQAFTLLTKTIDKMDKKIDKLDEKNGNMKKKMNSIHDDVLLMKKDFIKKPTLRQMLSIISVPGAIAGVIAIISKYTH